MTDATSIVLVHGGGFDSRCWDRLIPYLQHPVVAVDLPGRGSDRRPLAELRIADFVARTVEEIVGHDRRDVVLVGHSLAGISLPGVAAAVPERLRRLVFVACTVPSNGQSVVGTLDPAVRLLAEESRGAEPEPLAADVAAGIFCEGMDDEQCEWTLARLVAEAPGVLFEPVDLTGLDQPVPRTWVRLLRDSMVEPAQQDRFIAQIGGCDVVDLDAGHIAMITHPAELAATLDRVAEMP